MMLAVFQRNLKLIADLPRVFLKQVTMPCSKWERRMYTKIISALTVLCLATTGAIAKGHDQGKTEDPGTSVKTETVAAAHTLGSAKGNRPADKGPNKSKAVTQSAQ